MAEASSPAPGPWSRLLSSRSLAIPAVLIAANLALGVATNRWILRDFPNSADEYAYLLSARIFAEGRLSMASPSPARFFGPTHVVNDGKFYGKYPPGWPLILAAGVIAGAPWIVNLLLGAAALAATYALARRLFSIEAANLSMAMSLGNPYLVFNSASYFSHVACLLAIVLFAGASLLVLREPASRFWPLLAGAAGGAAFLIRPYTALCVAAPVIAYVVASGVKTRGWRQVGRWLVLGAGPAALFFATHLAYNRLQTGDALLFPFQHYKSIDVPEVASTADAVGYRLDTHVATRLIDLARWLAVTPLLAVLYAVFPSTRANRDGLLLAAIPLCLLAGHLFYRGLGGNQYGPRYLFEGSAFLLIVGGAVIASFGRKGAAVLAGILVLNVLGFVSAARFHGDQVRGRTGLYDLVARQKLNDAIVFVKSPSGSMPPRDLIRNGFRFDGPVLFALDHGRVNRDLLRAFPSRKAWIFEVDRRTLEGRLRPWREEP